MLLTVNIGNTKTNLGWYENNSLRLHAAIPTMRVGSEYLRCFEPSWPQPERVIVSSVVPTASDAWGRALKQIKWPNAHYITPEEAYGIHFGDLDYHELGADLFVNAVASNHFFGGNLLNVDLGTASTFCVVKQGQYLGTTIVPGLNLSLQALVGGTALLPGIEVKKVTPIIQTTTVTCLQSGIYHGYTALVRGLIQAILKEQGPLTVVLTGGIGIFLQLELDDLIDQFHPHLTLEGLSLIDHLRG